MKKYFKSLFVVVLLFTSLTASAHVLKTNGTIGAVLHIDPNDAPVAASVSTFNFDLTDTSKRFTTADCNCTFTITDSASGTQVENLPLADLSPIQYAFATPGVYTVVLAGPPKDATGFQPFSLTYDIRVEPGAAVTAQSDSKFVRFLQGHGIHIVLFGGAIIVAGGIILADYLKAKKLNVKK